MKLFIDGFIYRCAMSVGLLRIRTAIVLAGHSLRNRIDRETKERLLLAGVPISELPSYITTMLQTEVADGVQTSLHFILQACRFCRPLKHVYRSSIDYDFKVKSN